ncbi:PIN domain nuclease [Streptomyces rishiriensis]|uniref:PIN domain nuclease n=1 Tax=Streptomyces rishiriensis TaxID=68264 RepID=UPI000D597900|nr:PIN domain nuclease [Streptomyces rishiriensis]
MTFADYLIDTSALARVLLGQSTAEWDDRIGAGLVALCDLTELEVLYSTWCPMPDGIYRRARVVQELLTAKGEHRSEGPVDLLVAAAAEEAGLTLLHYDRDFETIARATGQPVRMIDVRD